MKKIYVIVIMAAFMSLAGKANAQVSVHAGYQNSALRDSFLSIKYNGFYAGGNYNIGIANNLGVAPGLYFSYASCNLLGESLKEMDLRVPILANYSIDVNRDICAFGFGGPVLGVNLVSDMEVRRFDLGLMFGAGIKYQNISVELGYNIGLLNRYDDDDRVTMNSFVVGLGYSF